MADHNENALVSDRPAGIYRHKEALSPEPVRVFRGFVTATISQDLLVDVTALYEPLDLHIPERQKTRDILNLINDLKRPRRNYFRRL